jgi:oligosaccharide repeat unit polymerase
MWFGFACGSGAPLRNHMISHLIFTGCILGLTIWNYSVGRRNVLYPPFLFSLIWLVVLLFYLIPLIEVDKLGADTLAIVVSGIVAFSVGGAMVGRTYSHRGAVSMPRNSISKRVIFFCSLALLPGFFLEIRRLSGAGGLESFLISARTAIVDAVVAGEKPFSNPIYTIAPYFAIFTAFTFLIEAREGRKERVWMWCSILTAFVFSLLTTGRTWLLELVVGLAGIHLVKTGRFSAMEAWKFTRWPLVVIIVLFSILVPLDKDISGVSGGTTGAITQYVFGYAAVPIAGFDYVVHHPSEYKYESNHTFKQVLPALARVSGLKYVPPPTVDDFVWVPLPTNLYTVFKYYYVDFGLYGMLLAMFLIGAGQTWLFRQAMTGTHFYLFLFAISLYPLAMVAFDDAYSTILIHAVALVFAVLYFRVLSTISFQARTDVDRSGPEQVDT